MWSFVCVHEAKAKRKLWIRIPTETALLKRSLGSNCPTAVRATFQFLASATALTARTVHGNSSRKAKVATKILLP